ncbi:Transcription factor [Cardamine amara subsp. amara]|uniref:Transcription factor n=1 Tax=Cardamine amara subsp. amara TaxID=228776 RepID=A0ABD0Z640_CARAN
MSSQPNHQTSTSSLLHDRLHIPAETIAEKDTYQSQRKGKEQVLHDQDDGSSGAAKKQNHNAKERLRRMRLHASYLTLGTLLPDHSSSSKKKWCAPSIIDRVITYIPKMQNEVEELTLRKQKLVELERRGPSIRAISVLELGESSGYEAVVQICMKKEKENEFSNLLHVMEVQGLSVLSASTSQVCQNQRVVCYNFHVKMNEKPNEGDDYITVLKNNIISSLS